MKIRMDFVTNSSSSSFLIISKDVLDEHELIYPLTLENLKNIISEEFDRGKLPDDKNFGYCPALLYWAYNEYKKDLDLIGISQEQFDNYKQKIEELDDLDLEDKDARLIFFQILDELQITKEQYYLIELMEDDWFEPYYLAEKALKEGKNVYLLSDGCCCYEGRDEILRIVEENELLWECGP